MCPHPNETIAFKIDKINSKCNKNAIQLITNFILFYLLKKYDKTKDNSNLPPLLLLLIPKYSYK